jgi:hypothetical protein
VLVAEDTSLASPAPSLPVDAVVDGIAEAFRTASASPTTSLGPAERPPDRGSSAPWARIARPRIIPAMDGLVDRLKRASRWPTSGAAPAWPSPPLAEAYPALPLPRLRARTTR